MQIVKSKEKDLSNIMEIIQHAQNYLADLNIDQWQNGYPNEERILQDIAQNEAYLLKDKNDRAMATAMFTTTTESTYTKIEGEWITDENTKYGVIHRMAVHNNFRKTGAARFLFNYFENQLLEQGIYTMRIDTHEDNLGMQKLLQRNGYLYCGVIYLEDGAKRLAFEKILVPPSIQTETTSTWNSLSEAYADKFVGMSYYLESYKSLVQLLPENAKILEIGCGPGNITKEIVKLLPKAEILATDVSSQMLIKAKEINPSIETQVMDIRDCKQINSSFNALICGFTFPYISPYEVSEFLKNAKSLLIENGFLYISFVPSEQYKSEVLGDDEKGRMIFHSHTTQFILNHAKKLNYEVSKVFTVNYPVGESKNEQHQIYILKSQRN